MNYKDILKKLKIADTNDRNGNKWTSKYVALPYKKNTTPGSIVEIRLRFLPDIVEAEKTGTISPFVRSFHSFRSRSTGKYIEIGCNSGHCPICDYCIPKWRTGDKDIQDSLRRDGIMKKTAYYLNAYVVDNPIDPTQNGKIRILKFGTQLRDKIDEAITGRDAERIGMRLFDLGKDGYTFVVKVRMKGEFPNYEASYVDMTHSEDDVKNLTDEDIDRIMHETIYIPEMFTVPDRDSVVRDFRIHYLCDEQTTTHRTTDSAGAERDNTDKDVDVISGVSASQTNEVLDTSPSVNDAAETNNDKTAEKSKEDQELDDILSGVQMPF